MDKVDECKKFKTRLEKREERREKRKERREKREESEACGRVSKMMIANECRWIADIIN